MRGSGNTGDPGAGDTPGSGAPNSGRVNSIGMDARELARLVRTLDQADGQGKARGGSPRRGGAPKKRVHARWPFLAETLLLELEQPAGGAVSLTVACRNISAGGASLLHRSYVHTNTACRVRLPHLSRGHAEIHGTIVHCQHLTGVVHELGVRFDKPIKIKEFLDADPGNPHYTLEHVDPGELTGRVLIADAGDLDRQILRHFLRDTNLRVTECGTGADAIRLASTGVSAVIADYHLPDMTGSALVEGLRACAPSLPVILLSGDKSTGGRTAAAAAGADASMVKPVQQNLLLRVLGEFLIQDGLDEGEGEGEGSVPSELSEHFIAQVRRSAQELAEAIQSSNAMSCYATCMRISGTAPCFGHDALAKAAEAAGQVIAETMNTQHAREELDALLSLCDRVGNAAA